MAVGLHCQYTVHHFFIIDVLYRLLGCLGVVIFHDGGWQIPAEVVLLDHALLEGPLSCEQFLGLGNGYIKVFIGNIWVESEDPQSTAFLLLLSLLLVLLWLFLLFLLLPFVLVLPWPVLSVSISIQPVLEFLGLPISPFFVYWLILVLLASLIEVRLV